MLRARGLGARRLLLLALAPPRMDVHFISTLFYYHGVYFVLLPGVLYKRETELSEKRSSHRYHT